MTAVVPYRPPAPTVLPEPGDAWGRALAYFASLPVRRAVGVLWQLPPTGTPTPQPESAMGRYTLDEFAAGVQQPYATSNLRYSQVVPITMYEERRRRGSTP